MVESPETGYFRDLGRFIEQRMLGHGLISQQDLSLFCIVKNPKETVEEVMRFYRVYHSSRYVDDKLVLRLERDLTDDEFTTLNDGFQDVLRSGEITRSQPLREERGTHLHGLACLELDFNRHDFGRLRQFIDRINAFDA